MRQASYAQGARAIWVVAFLIGGFNHGRDIAAAGWLPYDFAPLALNWFWTLLLGADIVAALLIAARRRAGVTLGVAIMLADVAANTWFARRVEWPALLAALQWQSLFLGFVLGTAPLLWQESHRRTR